MSGEQTIVVDRTVLDGLREAIGDKVNHIVQVYLDDVPKNIEMMRKSLAQLEYEAVRRLAHSLKSSSANLGAMHTSGLAASLEKSMKEGVPDEAKIAQAITEIEQSFEQSRTMFINYIG